MTTPSKEDLKAKIREVLAENEEEAVKLKVIRAALEKHFGVDLKDRKTEVKNLVNEVNNESDDESDSEDEEIKVTKKKKRKKKRKRSSIGDSDSEEDHRPKKKRKVDDIELSKNGLKRVKVQRYQGRLQVHIRNFYRKDEKVLPTKRGIALSVDQWEILKENIAEIDKMIESME